MGSSGPSVERHRTILHVDMDAFFVSVELRRRPDLRGLPVVVGGTGRRGVVAAASYEARQHGVFSAMPSAVARRRCPHAVFLPGDHALYGKVSEDVLEIFGRYTPLIEPLSLDEAFLDVTGATRLFGEGVQIGASIRQDVQSELDLSCSVGVAPNKFLAKMASVGAKPRPQPHAVEPGLGVLEVEPGTELEFLHPHLVSRLWGVGPVTLGKLERLGVKTIGDLAQLDERTMVGALGQASGTHLLALAHGRDDRPVETGRDAKSIGHEETFASNRTSHEQLRTELVRLADSVAARLRSAEVGARTLILKLRFDDGFRTITRSSTSDEPVDEAQSIVARLEPLLAAIDPSDGVRLLGVSGSNFGSVHRQLSFEEMTKTASEYGATLDEIRERFGVGAIGPASAVTKDGVRVVRKGAQQWGPDQG
jgi:DNA polymerase-4